MKQNSFNRDFNYTWYFWENRQFWRRHQNIMASIMTSLLDTLPGVELPVKKKKRKARDPNRDREHSRIVNSKYIVDALHAWFTSITSTTGDAQIDFPRKTSYRRFHQTPSPYPEISLNKFRYLYISTYQFTVPRQGSHTCYLNARFIWMYVIRHFFSFTKISASNL